VFWLSYAQKSYGSIFRHGVYSITTESKNYPFNSLIECIQPGESIFLITNVKLDSPWATKLSWLVMPPNEEQLLKKQTKPSGFWFTI